MQICFGGAVFFAVLEAVVLCLSVCLCRYIKTAIQLVQLSAKALAQMPYLFWYPLLNSFLLGCGAVAWLFTALLLGTSGELQREVVYGDSEWGYSELQKYGFLYWCAGLLWIWEFISAFGFTVCCFCCACWFFSPQRSHGRELPKRMLRRAFCITLSRFGGTLALGGLLLSLLHIARVLLEYVDRKQKRFGDGAPWLWRALFCCLRCCLWCLESCLRWLNKMVYIQTVLRNSGFCGSACQSAKVLVGNIEYLLVTKPVAVGVVYLGKLAIALGTTACGAIYILYFLEVNSIAAPLGVLLLIGLMVAGMFAEVFEVAVDTMLMCFCEAKTLDDGCDLPTEFQDFRNQTLEPQVEELRSRTVADPAEPLMQSREPSNIDLDTQVGVHNAYNVHGRAI